MKDKNGRHGQDVTPGAGPPPPPPAPSAGNPYAGSAYPGGYGAAGPGYAGAVHGHPGAGGGWPGQPLPQGLSVASMVIGIVGLVLVVTCWGSFLAILLAPLALIMGSVARGKVRRGELGGHGPATAGFVMGIVGTVLAAVVITFIVLTFTVWEDELNDGPSSNDPYTYDAARTPALLLPPAHTLQPPPAGADFDS